MTLAEFLADWHSPHPTLTVRTSGSTGKPKPMQVLKSRMEASARMTCDFLGLRPGNTALLCMPLDYIAGKMVVVRSLVRGLKLIEVTPSGHPLSGLSEVPDFAAMTPMQVWGSLQVPEERAMLRSVRQLIIGGGAIDSHLAAELADFPNSVWSTYGMTETLSHIAMRRLNGPEASDWYRPMMGVTVGQDERGCLTIIAPELCDTALITNDISELRTSDDGICSFRIKGRADNVICSGGIKIQAEEVEALLAGHLQTPFLITWQPDERLGQAVTLLSEGGDANQIAEACRRILPKYWVPKHIVILSALPRTETGKPRRVMYEPKDE